MSDLSALCRAVRTAQGGEPLFTATVVCVQGSAYRKPGARMLFSRSGVLAGSVSAGCLERDLVTRGPWRLRNQPALLIRYDASEEDEPQARTGCGGIVDVLVERFEQGARQAFSLLERCLEREQRGAIATVFRSRRRAVPPGARLTLLEAEVPEPGFHDPDLERELLGLAAQQIEQGGTRQFVSADGSIEALVEGVLPSPHLFVFGSQHDVQPVLRLAGLLGWSVTSCDQHERFATKQSLGALARRAIVTPAGARTELDARVRAAAVIMSHDYAYDRELLGELLHSRAAYVGMLGPRRRTERMLSELAARGVHMSREQCARLHAPVGLTLGAATPEEIALAIVAEVQGVMAGHIASAIRRQPASLAAYESDQGLLASAE